MEKDNNNCSPTKKRAKRNHFSLCEKQSVLNIFKTFQDQFPECSISEKVNFTAKAAGIGISSVYNIRREYKMRQVIQPPKRYHRARAVLDSIDEDVKNAIRRKVHAVYFKNESPTVQKILTAVNEDDDLPNFKLTTMRKLLKEINFRVIKEENEKSFENNIQDEESPLASEVQDILHPPLTFKTEDDSDIEIKEHGFEYVGNVASKFESSSGNIDNSDQFVFEINIQETDPIRLDNNIVNIESSTPASGGYINTPEAIAKQAIQDSWKNVVKNALTTFREQLSHNCPDPTEEKNNIINTVELCVLCGNDFSKLRYKKSVRTFLEMILTVTGVDITQYKIMPYSCEVCYSSLLAIKKFQKQVADAKTLICEKLSHLTENEKTQEFKFACVGTNDAEKELSAISNINNQNNIKTEWNDTQKIYVTEIQSDDVDMLNPTERALEIASSDNIVDNNIESTVNKSENVGRILYTVKFPTTESNIEEEKKFYSYKKNKRSNRKTQNKSNFKIACSVCGKLYSKMNYNKHMQTHKSGRIACKICGKKLKCSSLKSHLQKHENRQRNLSDKYICSQCGKSYAQICSLRRHEITHGEKKHLCRICNKSFHFNKYLKKHMRSHSGEKPYACSYCDRTFSIIWNFQQHQRLHTNSKPYKCQLCSATFRHNVTLKGHLASAHTANEIASIKSNNSANNLQTTDSTSAEQENDLNDSNKVSDTETY